jgi:hypothetical protein
VEQYLNQLKFGFEIALMHRHSDWTFEMISWTSRWLWKSKHRAFWSETQHLSIDNKISVIARKFFICLSPVQ